MEDEKNTMESSDLLMVSQFLERNDWIVRVFQELQQKDQVLDQATNRTRFGHLTPETRSKLNECKRKVQ